MITFLKIYHKIAQRYLQYFWLVLCNSSRLKPSFFEYQEKQYQYFFHPHNHTWDNERAVEIPLIVTELLKHKDTRVLEVGNVLHHYLPVNHDIVDKYEVASGVINVDIIDYKPAHKYDLIVSISTLEHVGWDENPHTQENLGQTDKIQKAVSCLKAMLQKGGRLVITVPIGYNPHLDTLLKKNLIKVDKIVYLQRIDSDNHWQEVSAKAALKSKFWQPYSYANALAILTVTK